MKRLGDYELLRKIGAGGMAEVWMGRRAALAGASKAVAIKLLARDLLDDPSYRQMFIEEARLSMLLTNSNVVQVFDVGEIDGECFMVMEWVDGLNLSELSRKMGQQRERLAHVIAAHVVGEVLRGLAYAHGLHHEGSKATIVHRDVSPQNVLVSVSGEVKLADFGVARLAREETSGLHVKGKLRYMAPEQLRGRSREPTVDLYAVGAILHELIEGTRFRQTRDEGDLYSMVLSGQYPPLTVEVPPELARLHAGLLEPDPDRRIQTADEALELLYSWPGYRNCSVELGRLVRKWIGVEAPRSGILNSELIEAARAAGQRAESGGVSSAVETLDAPTRAASASGSGPIGSGPHSMMTAVESGPVGDRGDTQTRTFAETAPDTEATALIAHGRAQRGSASSMLIVAAVTLALSFGVFGLGFPLGWWGGGGGDATVAAADTSTPPAEVEPVQAEELPAETTAVTPVVDSGESGGPVGDSGETGETDGDTSETSDTSDTGDETGDSDPSGDGDGDPTDKEEPPKKLKPQRVKFVLGSGLHFVYVKVKSKVGALEPTVDFDLTPDSYTVWTRVSPDDKWQRVGRIKVTPGRDLKVTLQKNGTLTTSGL